MSERINQLNADKDELQSLLKSATRQKVKDALSIEIRKIETIIFALRAAEEMEAKTSGDATNSQTKPVLSTIPFCLIRDYGWCQSDKFVKFYLTLPDVQDLDPSLITLTTTSSSCSLQACFPDTIRLFRLTNLLHEISPEKSFHRVKPDQVVILLRKVDDNREWTHVTVNEKQVKDAREAKKMDEFGKNSKDDPADPSQGIMNLMKKLYQEGDDDMKRTIAKAWTEGQEKRNTVNVGNDL